MAKVIQCPQCRKVIYADRPYCPHCGHGATTPAPSAASAPPRAATGAPGAAAASAAGPAAAARSAAAARPAAAAAPARTTRRARAARPARTDVPREILGWNWGAFLLNIVWGVAHRVWPALLMVLPGVNLFVALHLGARGNALAWQARRWESVAQFKRVQRRWAKAGLIFLVVAGLVIPAGLYFGLTSQFRNGQAYRMAMERLHTHPEARAYLGAPIDVSIWVSGSYRTVDGAGIARLAIPVGGPLGEGTLTLSADRRDGQWRLLVLVLDVDETYQHVDLMAPFEPLRPSEVQSR